MTWCVASHAGLTAEVLGARLDKRQSLRMSNWEAAPLSAGQRAYAAADAYASLRLLQARAPYAWAEHPSILPIFFESWQHLRRSTALPKRQEAEMALPGCTCCRRAGPRHRLLLSAMLWCFYVFLCRVHKEGTRAAYARTLPIPCADLLNARLSFFDTFPRLLSRNCQMSA